MNKKLEILGSKTNEDGTFDLFTKDPEINKYIVYEGCYPMSISYKFGDSVMIEKTGDSQIVVARDYEGNLTMRLPGNADIIPYDGRFGSNPLPDGVNFNVFPLEEKQ